MEEEFANEIMSNRQHTIEQLFNRLSHDGVLSVNIAGSVKSVESMMKSGMNCVQLNPRRFSSGS